MEEIVLNGIDPETFYTRYSPKVSKFSIGDYSYGEPTIRYDFGCPLTIGRFCSISADVTILLGGEHEYHNVSTYPFHMFDEFKSIPFGGKHKGPVNIGNDVWIGLGATILSGVTIGDGAVIGAKTVVSKDVPPYAIIVGNPASIKKYRFEPEIIEKLLNIRWWDWPTDRLKLAIPIMMTCSVQQFIEQVELNNI